MRYLNQRTGVAIEVNSKVSGQDWQEVPPPAKAVKKGGVKSDTNLCNDK